MPQIAAVARAELCERCSCTAATVASICARVGEPFPLAQGGYLRRPMFQDGAAREPLMGIGDPSSLDQLVNNLLLVIQGAGIRDLGSGSTRAIGIRSVGHWGSPSSRGGAESNRGLIGPMMSTSLRGEYDAETGGCSSFQMPALGGLVHRVCPATSVVQQQHAQSVICREQLGS